MLRKLSSGTRLGSFSQLYEFARDFPLPLPEKLWPFAVCKYRKFAPRTRRKGDEVGDMSSSSSSAAAAVTVTAAPRQLCSPSSLRTYAPVSPLPTSPRGKSREDSHHGMMSQYMPPMQSEQSLIFCSDFVRDLRPPLAPERGCENLATEAKWPTQIVLVPTELRGAGRVSGAAARSACRRRRHVCT